MSGFDSRSYSRSKAVRLDSCSFFFVRKDEAKDAVEDQGESMSEVPDGVNGARGSENCHAPSGRRIAMRMPDPGVCPARNDTVSARRDGVRRKLARTELRGFAPWRPKRCDPRCGVSIIDAGPVQGPLDCLLVRRPAPFHSERAVYDCADHDNCHDA